jgi:hypothetical protein
MRLTLAALLVSLACTSPTQTPPSQTPSSMAPTPSTAAAPTNTAAAPVGSSKSEYELLVEAPPTAKQGEEFSVKVTLRPAAGLKINDEYPHKLKVTGLPTSTNCSKDTLVAGGGEGKKDAELFEKDQTTFLVRCTAAEKGSKEFSGEYRFSVCRDNYCATPKEQLAWKVEVQ